MKKTPQEIQIEALEKRLKAVSGKAVFFKDQVIKIKSFKIFTKAVTLITDETSFSIEIHLVEKYLDELSGEIPVTFSPVDTSRLIDDDEKPIKYKFQEITPEQLKINDEMENQKIVEQTQNKETQLATTSEGSEPSSIEVSNYKPTAENAIVKETLMDMLKKVSTNPGMIPQAKAVCDIANTMVNIQKNEIQMIQMVNKIKA